jgi:hypothetical protein
MFVESKGRPVRRAVHLWADWLSSQCGILNISQPYRPPWSFTGIALLYILSLTCNFMATINSCLMISISYQILCHWSVFWDVVPFISMKVNRRFGQSRRSACCVLHAGFLLSSRFSLEGEGIMFTCHTMLYPCTENCPWPQFSQQIWKMIWASCRVRFVGLDAVPNISNSWKDFGNYMWSKLRYRSRKPGIWP